MKRGCKSREYNKGGKKFRISLPVIASVLKGLIVVQLVQPFSALHERELSTEADLLFCIRTAVEGAGGPEQN